MTIMVCGDLIRVSRVRIGLVKSLGLGLRLGLVQVLAALVTSLPYRLSSHFWCYCGSIYHCKSIMPLFYALNYGNLWCQIHARNFPWQMFDSKLHGHQSMKLQLSYEIIFHYVQKLQIVHLIPLKSWRQLILSFISLAGPVFRPHFFMI